MLNGLSEELTMQNDKMIGGWSASRLAMLVVVTALAALTAAEGANLLPNASFELGNSGRRYQSLGDNPFITSDDENALRFDGDAFLGRYCLRYEMPPGVTPRGGRIFKLRSRMLHTEPGPHVLSLYAKVTGAAKAKIDVMGTSFTVTTNAWTRYVAKYTISEKDGEWCNLSATITVPSDGALLLDAVMLEKGDAPSEFQTAEPVEFNLAMSGDWSRVFKETESLPPVEIEAYNSTCDAVTKELDLRVLDFWDRTVFQTNLSMTIPAEGCVTRSVPISLSLKGPFRTELYLRDGLLQDEMIFGVVPDISEPVLASQYSTPSPNFHHMYRTLGFGYGAIVGGSSWLYVQEKGPNEYNWDLADEAYRVYHDIFREVRLVHVTGMGGAPAWTLKKTDKREPFPPSFAPDRQFDLADFLAYLEVFARRYPEWKHLLLWNEPFTWKPEEVVELQRRSREVLDKVNPDIKILAPTTYTRQTAWMERFLKADGLKYTDVFAHHSYTAGGGESPDLLAVLPKWAHADGRMDRPLFNTETALHPFFMLSWYTSIMPAHAGYAKNAWSAEEGTERFAKMYLLQTAMGSSMFFSHVAPQSRSLLPVASHMRHGEPDSSRHPVAIGWAVAGHRIGTAEALGLVESPVLQILMFKKGNRSIAVIWRIQAPRSRDPIGDGGYYRTYEEAMSKYRGRIRVPMMPEENPLTFELPGGTLEVFDMFGNSLTPDKNGQTVVLPVSVRPLYVEVTGISPKDLGQALRKGCLKGVEAYTASVSLGRTRDGAGAVVADLSSGSAETATVRMACSTLALDQGALKKPYSVTTVLAPFSTSTIAVELGSQMPAVLEGQGGFGVWLSNGVNESTHNLSPLWVTHATARTVTVDGSLADWDGVPAITLGTANQAVEGAANWKGLLDGSAKLRLAWDARNLYLAAEVTDDYDTLGPRTYASDSIELFFDMDLRGDLNEKDMNLDDRQYYFNAPLEGQWPNGELRALDGVLPGGEVRSQRTEKGYEIEGRIPWECFMGTGFVPRPNEVFGFNVALCDSDKGEGRSKLVWTGAANPNLDTTGYGRVILSGAPGQKEDTSWRCNAVSAWEFNNDRRIRDLGSSEFDGKVSGANWRYAADNTRVLAFDGANSSVTFVNGTWSLKRKRFEIRFTAETNADAEQLLWVEPTAPGWRYRGIIDRTGRLRFELRDYKEQISGAVVSRTLVAGVPTMIDAAYEWDSAKGTLVLFINGQKEAEANMVIQEGTHNLTVGSSHEERMYFKGCVQRVGIFSLPLSKQR
jgi:hypothetical protein